ncbi:MAG: PcfJ domain-containing protein [Burkholderiales bacterium]|nr:PcfJ domain-containing protein [Burkholderiales bacterium]
MSTIPDSVDELPIRPPFGTLRGVAEGVALNKKVIPGRVWLSATPPSHLLHIHRPARISAIWERVLELLRNPVEPHLLSSGSLVFNILGAAVVIKTTSGYLTPLLWNLDGLDRPYLDRVEPRNVIVQAMPYRWLWLDRLLGFAKLEYQEELEFLHLDADSATVDGYFRWLSSAIRKAITRHADMRQVRRRIATALDLNAVALRRANCGVPSRYVINLACVQNYNNAVLMVDELDQLEKDAPHLLPLYMAMGNFSDFPSHGEPVQRLKIWLLQNGFTQRDWRYIFSCSRRLILPMSDVYNWTHMCAETLDYLRGVCALGLKQQCPEPLLKALFCAWGNPAERESGYLHYLEKLNLYPHLMSLAIRRFGMVPFAELESDLLLIVRWAREERFNLTKGQRRLGWDWLLEKANAYADLAKAKKKLSGIHWSIPVKQHEVGSYQLRFLETSYDLWEESITMQNCVDQFSKKCMTTNARLASVKHGDRRVATAMFDWDGDELKLMQISGKANRAVSEVMAKRLSVLKIPKGHFAVNAIPATGQIVDRSDCTVVTEIAREIYCQHQAKSLPKIQRKNFYMTATITNTGGYLREVEIAPVKAVANTFHMEFRSRLLSAKNPNESQRNFSLTLERDGLIELRELIDRTLTQT